MDQSIKTTANSQPNSIYSSLIFIFGLPLLPTVCLIGFDWVSGTAITAQSVLIQYFFGMGTIFLVWLAEIALSQIHAAFQISNLLICAISAAVFAMSQASLAAWVMVMSGYALLIQIHRWWGNGQSLLQRIFTLLFLADLAGGTVTAILQIEERFSEEEFFALIQAFVLSIMWLLLAGTVEGGSILLRNSTKRTAINHLPGPWRTAISASLILLLGLGSLKFIQAYQHSFYPSTAPTFPGISVEKPFLCGTTSPLSKAYKGEVVFAELVGLVEANPLKGILEYGFLALASSESGWAESFQQALLAEARQQLFTRTENSVKYGQCQAARRAFFYARVKEKYPELFNPAEKQEIVDWFAAINQRALSIGWVDWMYALAFSKWPSGPYENQECGAGLIAILEAEHLASPALSVQNLTYLRDWPRGWQWRFRNNDDTYIYQAEWLQHAWFQYLFSDEADPVQLSRSFEWYFLQALPDGAPLTYNHFVAYGSGLIDYWAGTVLAHSTPALEADPAQTDLARAAVWLAGLSADYLTSKDQSLYAQPGLEMTTLQASQSPSWGSCLIYANSGLPNQLGPLAADKIVFRDGWDSDSAYLLLNLRFTGWHRYKATNSIVLAYQSNPIITEINSSEMIPWLPKGRSLLRDKRIPRENLNGLLIERSGVSAVVHQLTGVGSPWAQDPPHLARVEQFVPGKDLDISTTVLEDWRGWHQRRTILFSHSGVIVVADQVQGPAGQQAGLSWHFLGELESVQPGRFEIGERGQSATVTLLPINGELDEHNIQTKWDETSGATNMIYQPGRGGGFSLLTILLLDEWAGAEVSLVTTAEGARLTVFNGDHLDDSHPLEFLIP